MVWVFLAIVTAAFSLVLGVGLGWILHHHVSGAQLEVELASARGQRMKKTSKQEADHSRAAALMAKLAELTTGMASEVGKHSGNLEAINAELATVKDGDAGAVVTAVKKILGANAQMQQELVVAENRLQEQQRELVAQTEAARTDELTKITNRRALDEELKKCVLEFQQTAQPFSLMVLDVDHFKKFNDAHGHQAGDEVLKFVAQTLQSQARDGELFARYGGEEFVVLFRGAPLDACRDRAERLRVSIHEGSITFEGKQLQVAASAGIAQIRPGEDDRMLIRRADEALYISKKAGRNCSHWNDGEQNLRVGGEPRLAERHPRPRRFDLVEAPISDANFTPDLDRRVNEWKRTGHPFSVVVCAIDDFEELGKLHGDEIQQRVMSATASVVSSFLRDMDLMTACGEGAFAISLPTAQIQDAVHVAERIHKAVERIHVPGGVLPEFTVSLGLAEVLEGNDAGRVLDRALLAVEMAQESSGNCTFLHDGLHAVPAAGGAKQAALA